MTKSDVVAMLMQMRNENKEKEPRINNLLGIIDMKSEEEIQRMIKEIGGTEEAVRKVLEEKIAERRVDNGEKYPLNKAITYGITGSTIHLHFPIDLLSLSKNKGVTNAINTANLYLIDALDKVRNMMLQNNQKLQGSKEVFMISPILVKNELEILKRLGFETGLMSKKMLSDEEFVKENKLAQLATKLFGNKRNVGVAKLGMEQLLSDSWIDKKQKMVDEIHEEGIFINENDKEIVE